MQLLTASVRRIFPALFASVALALTSAAATLTWTGGATGSLTDATWSDGSTTRAPQSGDRLVIPSGTTVTDSSSDGALLRSLDGCDLAGTLVADGLTAANFSLPNAFSLAGAGSFKVFGNGAMTVLMYCPNTDFSGELLVSNACFKVMNNQAFGSARVSVYRGSYNTASSFFYIGAGGTYANELYIHNGMANSYYAFATATSDSIELAGPVTCKSVSGTLRFIAPSGGLTFSGGLSCSGSVDMNTLVYLSGDDVTYGSTGSFMADNGTLHIAAPFASTVPSFALSTVSICDRENVLSGVPIALGGNYAHTTILDLNGHSQTAGSLTFSNMSATSTDKPTLTSTSGAATLTLSGAKTATLTVALEGALSLTLDNASAALTLNDYSRGDTDFPSTTTGDLTAKAGTLTLGPTALFTSLHALNASGGTLAIASGARVNPDVALAVSGTGVVSPAAGVTLKVAALTLNGVTLGAGTYSKSSPGALEGHIDGDGSLTVVEPTAEPDTLVWQGGTGDFSDANWRAEGESASHAPVAGYKISIPSGSKVTVTDSSYSLFTRMKGAALDGELVLSGLTTAFTQDGTFPLTGAGKLSVNACTGGILLKADNSAFTGEFSFLLTKVMVYHARALGLKNTVTASYGNTYTGASYFFLLVDGTFENPLFIDGGAGYFALEVGGKHTVTWAGLVTCMNTVAGVCPRFRASDSASDTSYLTFTGGMVGKSGASAGRADLTGNVTLAGEDVTYCLPSYFFTDGGNLCIAATIDPATYLDSQKKISFGKANVVAGVRLNANTSGTFDLNGYDQTTDEITHPVKGNPVFTSEAGAATLTLNGTSSGGCLGAALKGHLSFAFDNAEGSVTLTNSSANVSTTDGKIIARAGTLTLGATAQLPNVSALRVENGTLAVEAGAAIPLSTRLEFAAGTGVLNLGTGVSLTVDSMTLDGAFLPKGTYSLANPGELAGRIAGAGELVVINSSGEVTETHTYHWCGGSGTSLATAANWTENKVPALKGADILVFGGESSSAPSVEGAIDAYGIVFDGSADFTLGGGAGALIRLGAGNFSVTNAAGAGTVTFTVQPAVELQSNHLTWSVGANAVLALPSALSAAAAVNRTDLTVTVNGAGSFDLGGDNAAFKPAWNFTDAAFVPVIRHSGALGSSERAIDVRSVPNGAAPLTNAVPINVYDSTYTPVSRHAFNKSGAYFDQRGRVTLMSNATGYLSLRRNDLGRSGHRAGQLVGRHLAAVPEQRVSLPHRRRARRLHDAHAGQFRPLPPGLRQQRH